jgi:uncharacterized protein
MADIKGTAVVTGPSSGIGAIYADRLAKRGYDLVLVARDQTRMEALAARLRGENGVRIEILAADLTADADVTKVELRLAAGDVRLLVNNAGMSLNGGILDNDASQLTRIIALNVTTPTRLASAAGKAFVKQGGGAIVNIASVVALAPERFDGVYSGTKAFLLNLSLSMAASLKDKAVYVQAVLPGATRTEIWERSGKDVNSLPAEMVMDAGDLVDAALVGFDRGETVTIPSLSDENQWAALQETRLAMAPNLSRRDVAARYLNRKGS